MFLIVLLLFQIPVSYKKVLAKTVSSKMLKSHAVKVKGCCSAVHLGNEGGSLNGIVCNTENTSLKRIPRTAKVVWQQIGRVDLGDCRCWKIFFSSVWQYLVDLPFQLLKNISSICIKILICFSLENTYLGSCPYTCLRYIRRFEIFFGANISEAKYVKFSPFFLYCLEGPGASPS